MVRFWRSLARVPSWLTSTLITAFSVLLTLWLAIEMRSWLGLVTWTGAPNGQSWFGPTIAISLAALVVLATLIHQVAATARVRMGQVPINDGLLRRFNVFLESNAKFTVQGLLESEDAGQVAHCIRSALHGIANVAARFDSGSNETGAHVYGANLMFALPNPIDDSRSVDSPLQIPTEEEWEGWLEKLRFCSDSYDRNKLTHVLALSRHFAATNAAPQDFNLEEFALPIPSDSGGKKRMVGWRWVGGWRMLPGAPQAFTHRRIEHFRDTKGIATWCRSHGWFEETVVQDVDAYFGQRRDHMVGFLSMPIYLPEPRFIELEDRVPIAVLSVHWNRSGGALTSQEQARLFGHLVHPFVTLVALGLEKYFTIATMMPMPGDPVELPQRRSQASAPPSWQPSDSRH